MIAEMLVSNCLGLWGNEATGQYGIQLFLQPITYAKAVAHCWDVRLDCLETRWEKIWLRFSPEPASAP